MPLSGAALGMLQAFPGLLQGSWTTDGYERDVIYPSAKAAWVFFAAGGERVESISTTTWKALWGDASAVGFL